MQTVLPEAEPVEAEAGASPPRPNFLRRVLGLIAAVWVVQTYNASRKLTFQSGPPSPNRATRAIEHKVQMAKKQSTMTAPAIKRIVSTGISKVTLPEMPAMPTSPTTPNQMAGASGASLGAVAGPMGTGGGSAGGGLVSNWTAGPLRRDSNLDSLAFGCRISAVRDPEVSRNEFRRRNVPGLEASFDRSLQRGELRLVAFGKPGKIANKSRLAEMQPPELDNECYKL